MSRWSAIFNNGVSMSSGVSFAHTRAYATVDVAGQDRGVNEPVYSFSRLYASPPRTDDVIAVDSTSSVQRMACGEWPDGSGVVMHQRDVSLDRRLNLHVNPTLSAGSLASNPSRSVNIYCDGVVTALNPNRGDNVGRKTGLQDVLFGAGVSQGESADWINAPTAYQFVGGTPALICACAQWNGSAYETRAISMLWWDESLSGTNKWRLHYRGPVFGAGLARGQRWQFPQATTLGNPNELWTGFTDYLENPAGTGGQFFICKWSRSGPGQPFTPGGVRFVLQVNSQSANEHEHFCAVVRHGTAGIAIVGSGGDTGNARTYVKTLPHEDYMAGDDGNPIFTYTTQAADEIVNGEWKLYPNAGGDRAATLGGTAFSAGSWNNVTKVLSATALNSATIGDRVGYYLVINSGSAGAITTPVQARVTAHSSTSVTLPALNFPNASDWEGVVCATQASHQPVACYQLADGRLYFGCDESSRTGTICNLPTFAPGDRVIRWEAVGDPLTTHVQEWNQFQAVGSPANRNRLFVGKYESSSFDSDASGKVMVSDGGRGFASIYAPNAGNMASNGMHGVVRLSGETFVLYTTSSLTQAIREPRYVQRVRPLLASSPAIRNHLTAGTYAELGSSSPSTYEVVERSSLATLVPGHVIPPPPANGQIVRINTRREYGTVRVFTAATVPTNQRVMVTGWVYNLPTLANAAIAPYIWVGDGSSIGNAIARNVAFTHQRLDGFGWHRITMQAGLPATWASNGAGTFFSGATWSNAARTISAAALNVATIGSQVGRTVYLKGGTGVTAGTSVTVTAHSGTTLTVDADINGASGDVSDISGNVGNCSVALSFRSENGNRWNANDMLFVPEAIVTGDVEVPVIAPPAAGDTTYAEASSRLNVPLSGSAWTCIMRGSLPPHGGDEYQTNRNASRVLYTLSNGTNSARVTLDPANNRVSVTDGSNTVHCTAPAGQVMHFDRNSQVTVALSLSGTTLRVSASIDGTVINSATGTFTTMTFDRVLSGDASNANGEPFEWWALEGYPTAMDATQLADAMRAPPQQLSVSGPFDIGRTRAR